MAGGLWICGKQLTRMTILVQTLAALAELMIPHFVSASIFAIANKLPASTFHHNVTMLAVSATFFRLQHFPALHASALSGNVVVCIAYTNEQGIAELIVTIQLNVAAGFCLQLWHFCRPARLFVQHPVDTPHGAAAVSVMIAMMS